MSGGNDDVIKHYDALIDEGNDPVYDPPPLRAYMDKWDGPPFLDALQLLPEKSVLEIGVGTGRLAVRVCPACARFTGIDISPKTIERARENLRKYAHAELICGDYLTCPFAQAYDVIYSSLTFLHIRDKRAAIQKTASLLKPEGRFVLSIDRRQQTEIDWGGRRIEVYPDLPDETAALLAEAGLSIEKQFETEFAVLFVTRRQG